MRCSFRYVHASEQGKQTGAQKKSEAYDVSVPFSEFRYNQ